MRQSIQIGDFKLHPLVYKLIARNIKKLDTLLVHYHPDMLILKVTIEMVENKNLYVSNLVLSIPNQIQCIEKQSKDVMESLGQAFDTVIREVKKFKERLRKEYTYQDWWKSQFPAKYLLT